VLFSSAINENGVMKLQISSNSIPLVSVVMPVRECNPKFLEKSIESIFRQTLTNWELIVILDTTDEHEDKRLFAVLKKFNDDTRLRVVVNKGNGFVEALNTGVSVSRGKYIARMDGDDISLPNRLMLQVESLEKLGADLVGGWAYVIDEHGKTIGKLTPPTDAKKIRRIMMLHNPFLHSAVIFKKSILKRSGLYNSALFGAEDYDLWLRLVSLGYNCVNLPCFVIRLRETSNSVSRGQEWKKTRANYAKAKSLALTKLGYTDPISISFCFLTPFSVLFGPSLVLNLKFVFGWFRKDS
jgi:glycosyltransferase involved in cell wall biosynthesis